MTRLFPITAFMLLLGPAALAQSTTDICADTQVYLMDNVRTNYSMGYENFKNQDWCAALPYLRYVLEHDPLYTGGEPDARNYRRLADTYEGLAGLTEDPQLKRAYLDSSRVARDQMYDVILAEGFDYDGQARLFERGRFLQQHAGVFDDEQSTAFDLYLEGFRMEPDSTDDYYLNYIGRVAAERAASEEISPMEGRDLVEELLTYADDPTYLQGVRESFRIEPIEHFYDLYEAYRAGERDEDDTKVLFVMATEMDSLIAATYPEIDPPALADELLPVIVEYNPSVDLLAAMSSRAFGRGDADEGIRYIERAIEMAESDEQKRDLWYTLANRVYAQGKRGEAYRLAGNALQFDSSFGPALYLRASVVAGTVNSGTLRGRMAYWCVADLFSRAAAAGGPTAAEARRLAGRYAASGPSREQYFFEGFRQGQSVTTSHGYGSCTTTVR